MSEQDPATPTRHVRLRADEFTGPFWDDEGHISDDFDELHRWLGISRQLFDDAMAWNESVSLRGATTEEWKQRHFAQQQELLRRLGAEVRPGIEVESPRSQPPLLVELSRLSLDAETGRLVLRDQATTARVTTLPATPDALTRRVLAWIADARAYEHATGDNDAAIFAWEDEGSAIARELGLVLGEDHQVVDR